METNQILEAVNGLAGLVRQLSEQLDRIDRRLVAEAEPIEREWTPAEVAAQVGRAALTVREWARLGKIPSRTDSRGRRWISDATAQAIFRFRGLPPAEDLAALGAAA
jgi:streptogramin lyase